MKTGGIKNFIKNKYFKYAVLIIIGLIIGKIIFSGTPSGKTAEISGPAASSGTGDQKKQIWTCAMHPQIRMDHPGKCPICGMDLIPLKGNDSGNSNEDNSVKMSDEALALADVQTTVVSSENPIKTIRLYGTVEPDERLTNSQVSHYPGRIEKLYADFTGQTVRKGQTIAMIYSPDLLNAQQELIEATKMKYDQPELVRAAKEKLFYWKLTGAQINNIQRSGRVSALIALKANAGGIIINKKVNQGDYVNQGDELFQVSDLSRVWVIFEVYETDIAYIKRGDRIRFTLQAFPGRTFEGTVSFIDPVFDSSTRAAKIRVEVSNPGFQLKPGMYADAYLKASLGQYRGKIVIPKTAVLWTGRRSVVYVKTGSDTASQTYQMREVELGPSLGESYVILSGLRDGEEIVTNGVYSIDASAQLEGKSSMMNRNASKSMSGGMNMEGMNMNMNMK